MTTVVEITPAQRPAQVAALLRTLTERPGHWTIVRSADATPVWMELEGAALSARVHLKAHRLDLRHMAVCVGEVAS